MSAATTNRNRQVIPRWRDLRATVEHGELGNALRRREPTERDASALADRMREFQQHRSLSFAADLINASIVVGPTPETKTAAELVLATHDSPPMVKRSARWILDSSEASADSGTPSYADQRRYIAQLRSGLRNNPRNVIRWAELSRHYANSGYLEKAKNAMRISVNMAPTDRYILRCAVRLWMHLDDPESAVKTLGQAQAVVVGDPWLLASEIAASAAWGRPSRNIKRGRLMVEAARHSPFALSELTSALATIEMDAGAAKQARRLFRTALIDPNENSVAQAEWASSRISLEVDDDQLDRSPEARARHRAETDDIDATLDSTWAWLSDQPFSSEPPTFGSYQASMFGRYEDGARLAREGLRANPRDTLLWNNLAFCEAWVGRLDDAEKALQEIDRARRDAHEREEAQRVRPPTLTATRGLVRFRRGDAMGGRSLYRQAIEEMTEPKERLRAEMMLVGEEIRAGIAESDRRANDIARAVERTGDRQLVIWLRVLPR
ncbi:MAG TPA: hypothetical protein VHY83_04905 [Solirubrobacteraceae bacterium]|jgi:tetratricopeptide (TPR) repeat protein|nr:hypothetical protein [Solirubrobacteraceae bacterium]